MDDTLPSVERVADLQQLIARFGAVERALNLPGSSRKENDNDHSFGLALTCWYLQPKITPELDLLEILKLALAHDLVELHAGDTFAFDKAAVADKQVRERSAVSRLRADWPDFTNMVDYAEHYMDRASEEARFVKAVDKLLPPLMIELNGADEWQRLGITLAMEKDAKRSLHISNYLSPYYKLLLEWLEQRGHIPRE